MRILHVVRQFYPAIGGLESFVLSLARQQRLEGQDAEILTLSRVFHQEGETLAAEDVVEGVPVRRIGYIGSHKYPIAPSAGRMLRGFDIVHVHGVDFFCDYLAALRLFNRKLLVLSTHGGFFHTGYAKTLKRVYFHTATRVALRSYSRVFASSVNDLAIFEPLAGRRVMLVENGVDTGKFRGASAETFRPSYLFLGRFASNKRLDLLIEVFRELAERDPLSELYIVGRDWDGMQPKMEAAIRTAGLECRAHILTGLREDEIRQIMHRCSFFITASEYEGFGISLVEAMSAGLIPIASSIPSFRAILAKVADGLVLNFADTKTAATSIARFVTEAKPRYKESRESLIRASEPYSWCTVAREFTRHYETVMGERRRTILGISFETRGQSAAVSAIDDALNSGQRVNIAFANAHSVNLATRDPAFLATLSNFWVLNDGLGVDIASRIKFGKPFVENLNGTDFVPHFFRASRHRYRIFLVGAQEDVVARAAQILQERFPQHEIAGYHHGYFPPEENAELCQRIRDSKANVVLVGMGNPRQEFWIAENGEATGAEILFGVGALFDFMSGRIRRAPTWVRNARFEWLYRFLQEPRRLWRRYLIGNAAFLKKVLFDQWAGGEPPTSTPKV